MPEFAAHMLHFSMHCHVVQLLDAAVQKLCYVCCTSCSQCNDNINLHSDLHLLSLAISHTQSGILGIELCTREIWLDSAHQKMMSLPRLF